MTSDGDEDKDIVNRINAVKKGRRLSAFSFAPDDEKTSTKGEGRDLQDNCLIVSNLPTGADLLLRLFGYTELLQFEAKYTLQQQDC